MVGEHRVANVDVEDQDHAVRAKAECVFLVDQQVAGLKGETLWQTGTGSLELSVCVNMD